MIMAKLPQHTRPGAQGKKTPVTRTEVGLALARSKSAFWGVGIFSAFINLLMLTGPIYMLQVYDRVLASSSVQTLVTISLVMLVLYAFMGFFDYVRSRVLVRIGNALEADLGARTFSVWMRQGLYGKAGQRHRPLQDLSTLKQFLSGSAPSTFFDIPWVPAYLAVMYLFHPLLFWAGLVGAIVIFILAWLNEVTTRTALREAHAMRVKGQTFADAAHRNADTIAALGMADDLRNRWGGYASKSTTEGTSGADKAGSLTAATKAFRMFVQSGILGLGGYLAVQQIITPGTMIAGSIVMGRALAPIQMAIGQWRGFTAARGAFGRLNAFYDMIPETSETMALPTPEGKLSVEQVIAAPPGSQAPVLTGINFQLNPGQGLGVIGPSASGKSTLARLLVGIWSPQKGAVRLDSATFAQWDQSDIGKHIGYLPQDVELFDGTIGENISRFSPDAKPEDIVLAARRAGVHDMILRLPDGYDSQIGEGGSVLSGGQNQRVALARALYGDPVLVVLDEPNASLDSDGDAALSAAIADLRKRGRTVVVMAHRPSALAAVDQLLVLADGRQTAFGPKEEVIAEMRAKNHGERAPAQAANAKVQPLTSAANAPRRASTGFTGVTPIKGGKN